MGLQGRCRTNPYEVDLPRTPDGRCCITASGVLGCQGIFPIYATTPGTGITYAGDGFSLVSNGIIKNNVYYLFFLNIFLYIFLINTIYPTMNIGNNANVPTYLGMWPEGFCISRESTDGLIMIDISPNVANAPIINEARKNNFFISYRGPMVGPHS